MLLQQLGQFVDERLAQGIHAGEIGGGQSHPQLVRHEAVLVAERVRVNDQADGMGVGGKDPGSEDNLAFREAMAAPAAWLAPARAGASACSCLSQQGKVQTQ